MSTTTNHTPGPWLAYNIFRTRIFKHWHVIAEDGHRKICTVADVDDSDLDNARLIAAAPDLLHIARGLLALAEAYSPERAAENTMIAEAKAVIAKATA